MPRPTKLSAPELPAVIARPRLFAMLDGTRSRALWIAAPAGSGKTCLAAGYVEARASAHLWLQLDAEDGEVASFFHFLGMAARKLGRFKRFEALSPEYRKDVRTFSQRYFRALFAALPEGALVVLDNYESIPAESELHSAIAEAIGLAAPRARLLILSRSRPPEEFARLLLERRLQRLGWEALRLTRDETEALVAAHDQQVDSRPGWLDAERLLALSDGWPAGVVLFLESPPHAATFQERGRDVDWGELRHEVIFDYFAGEVFRRLSAAQQSFLLKTACLPVVDGSVARELTGDPAAASILHELSSRNYFTFRYDQAGVSTKSPAFQYHPLFRAFLQSRALDVFSARALSELRGRAAQLLARDGQVAPAAQLLREALAWTELARLAVEHAEALLEQGRNDTLANWISAIPLGEVPELEPWLLHFWGVARMPFDPIQARELFQRAFQIFVARGDAAGLYQAWSGGVEASLFSWNDFGGLSEWVDALEPLLAVHKMPALKIEARVAATMYSALIFIEPGSARVAIWEKRVRRFLYVARLFNVNHYILLANNLFHYDLWRGRVAKAKALLDSLEGAARSKRAEPVPRLAWYTMKAVYACFSGDFEYGLQAVEEGYAIGQSTGVHFWDFLLVSMGVFCSLGAHQLERAERYLERLRPLVNEGRQLEMKLYHDAQAQLALARGDRRKAMEHSQHALEYSLRLDAPFTLASTHLGHAECLCELGEYDAARSHVARGITIANSMASSCLQARLHFSLAHIELRQGNLDACDAALARAWAISRQHEHWTFIWWRRDVMARLCERALEMGIEVEFVSAFVRRRGLAPRAKVFASVHWPARVRVLTLGEFGVLVDGEPLRFARKAQRRPLELLQALVARGGLGINESHLGELLWPDADGDASDQSMATTLHRLRKLLGGASIVRQAHCLSLNPDQIWVDALVCDHVWSAPDCHDTTLLLATLELYKGPFLRQTDAAWAIPWRERSSAKFVRTVCLVGSKLEASADRAAASSLYERSLDAEPAAAPLHQALITLHERAGQHAEAQAARRRYQALCPAFGAGGALDVSVSAVRSAR